MSDQIILPRLPLFTPGCNISFLDKAIAKGAESVIVDLEDAVAPERKGMARDNLQKIQHPVFVRINGEGSSEFENDLNAVKDHPLIQGIIFPKSESKAQLDKVHEFTNKKIIPLIESAEGLNQVQQLAEHHATITLSLGHLDLAMSLRCQPDFVSLQYARSQIVLACALAKIPTPIDGITQSFTNVNEVLQDCLRARQLGFGGKLLIHPAQIIPAKQGFCPTEEEYEFSKRVIEISPNGAAAQIDGKMIDAPVVEQARLIIRDYELMKS